MLINNNRRYYKWMACAKLCWFVCCSSIYLLLPMMRSNPDNESVAIQGLDKIFGRVRNVVEKPRRVKPHILYSLAI